MLSLSPTYVSIDFKMQPHEKTKTTFLKHGFGETKEYGSSFAIEFRPADNQLMLINYIAMDGSTQEISEGIFKQRASGLYAFSTVVDLNPQHDSASDIFQEKVMLESVSYQNIYQDMIENKDVDTDLLFKLFDKVQSDFFSAIVTDHPHIAIDLKQIITEEKKQKKEFLLEERYIALAEYKTTQYTAQKNSEIVETGDDAPPVYMNMIGTLADKLKNHDTYAGATVSYVTDAYQVGNGKLNPFHDFIINLQDRDSDPQIAFFTLASALQNRL